MMVQFQILECWNIISEAMHHSSAARLFEATWILSCSLLIIDEQEARFNVNPPECEKEEQNLFCHKISI